ncbi:hypothetical protein ERO13_D04G068375v2 [Gossypium hirsutum]|uniref:Uncharacterized protein n=2 Tax=Gossypium TaxID=3633 RepID=A0A5J5RTA9_GOSBA|nr:hypothetical protein ES319_D04G074900v1 [Gossypium barbadense]KAG4151465.1 hypothetical protein ERO13_D04G068375v2 [Gossypium hirsutum]TYI86600.1 hypothetical protein E1A91_D04G076200v1 [Gossypium mustelinum]
MKIPSFLFIQLIHFASSLHSISITFSYRQDFHQPISFSNTSFSSPSQTFSSLSTAFTATFFLSTLLLKSGTFSLQQNFSPF